MRQGGQRYFFHEDCLGSIRKVTDNTGALVEQYGYDDFGEPSFFDGGGAPLAGTQIGNDTLFTGRRYDPETGLYYYRTRFLDPFAGRFTSRDSIGIWADAKNAGNGYTYVGNDPVSAADPLGTMTACTPPEGFTSCQTDNQGICWCKKQDNYCDGRNPPCNDDTPCLVDEYGPELCLAISVPRLPVSNTFNLSVGVSMLLASPYSSAPRPPATTTVNSILGVPILLSSSPSSGQIMAQVSAASR